MNKIIKFIVFLVLWNAFCFGQDGDKIQKLTISDAQKIAAIAMEPYKETLKIRDDYILKMPTKDDLHWAKEDLRREMDTIKNIIYWEIIILVALFGYFGTLYYKLNEKVNAMAPVKAAAKK